MKALLPQLQFFLAVARTRSGHGRGRILPLLSEPLAKQPSLARLFGGAVAQLPTRTAPN
jgi:hypothetical protein